MVARTAPTSRGFTLVELLVTMAIVAIIAAIATPRLLGAREKAKVATCDGMFTSITSKVVSELEFAKGLMPLSECNATTPAAVESCIVGKLADHKNPRAHEYPAPYPTRAYVDHSTQIKSCQVQLTAQSTGYAIVLSQLVTKTGATRTFLISVD